MSNHKIAFKTKFGSHVYGTDGPESDTDYKGIFIPNIRDIVLGTAKNVHTENTKINKDEKNSSHDVDFSMYSLKKYLNFLCDGEVVAIDMLFTPCKHWDFWNEIWGHIQINKNRFISRNIKKYVGYCTGQAAKYGVKGSRLSAMKSTIEFLNTQPQWDNIGLAFSEKELLNFTERTPHVNVKVIGDARYLEVCGSCYGLQSGVGYSKDLIQQKYDAYGHRAKLAEKNEGVDWKAMSHAIRVCNQAEEILRTGYITFPRPEAEYLKNVKRGKLKFKAVQESLEEKLEVLDRAGEISKLPEKPDLEFMNDFIFDVYYSQ